MHSSKQSSKRTSKQISKHNSELEDSKPKSESPYKGIKAAFDKLRNEKVPTTEDCQLLQNFAVSFITCSLKNPLIAKIVKEVNKHHHTRTNRKHGNNNRFYFPKKELF